MSFLLSARGLTRRHPEPRTAPWRPRTFTTALEDADIDVAERSAVGVIGESGSGK